MTKRSRKVDILYAIIRHAAANGLDAPKNVALAAAIGAASPGHVPAYIRQMSDDGRLTVERGESHKVRRFYVPEVGRWTEWNITVASGTRDGSDPSGSAAPVTRRTDQRRQKLDIIHAALRAAAVAGQPAPTQQALATAIGHVCKSSVPQFISDLVADGRIVKGGSGKARLFYVREVDAWTAWPDCNARAGSAANFSSPKPPPRRTGRRRQKMDIIHAALRAAAVAGQPAPTQQALATAIGHVCKSNVPQLISDLVADGRIVKDGGMQRRRFYVQDVDAWTAWPDCNARAVSPGPSSQAAVPMPAAPGARQAFEVWAGEPSFGRTVPRVVAPIHFSTCQYLAGEPRDRDFCGAPVKLGSPYCPAHHKRCYRQVDSLPDADVPDGSGEAGFSGPVMDAAE